MRWCLEADGLTGALAAELQVEYRCSWRCVEALAQIELDHACLPRFAIARKTTGDVSAAA